jgi:hypothetical protein
VLNPYYAEVAGWSPVVGSWVRGGVLIGAALSILSAGAEIVTRSRGNR